MPYHGGMSRQYRQAMKPGHEWTDPALRAAWARADWAAVFRAYRRAAGISQTRLAERVGFTQGAVSRIEAGHRTVTSAAVVARITEGLRVPVELGGTMEQPNTPRWAPDPALRERLAHAHARGRADIPTARWIATVLREHRRAEDAVGGRDLWGVVRAQLDTVTRLIPSATSRAADELLALSAEHAHWLSWVAHTDGAHGAAHGWLDLAHGWATDAGSADLRSWITRVRAYYNLTAGDPVRALRTAEVAQHAERALSPAAAGIAAHTAAMAAAAAGDRDRARRLADDAYDLTLRVADETERPGWLYWLDPTRAALDRADVAYAVRDWTTAADGIRAALPQLTAYPRDHAYYEQRMRDAAARA